MNCLDPQCEERGLTSLECLAEAAECLKAVAHPHRLRMIQMLLKGKYTVGELAEACGISSPAASGHLRILKDRGMLDSERDGRTVLYHVIQPGLEGIMGCVEKNFSVE